MNEAEARRALDTVGLEGSTVTPILGGWAFWTFDIDDVWIVRFPRTPEIADSAERELRLLPELVGHLSFPVPAPTHRGAWKGMPFFAYLKIPGRGLTRRDGSASVLRRLGEMIGEIHTFPIDQAAVLLGISDSASALRDGLDALWPTIEASALPHMGSHLADRVVAEFHRFVEDLPDVPASFIHNDLGLEHLLVDESTGKPSGIIDFESAWIGDPAIDFVPLAATFGPEGLALALGQRDLGERLDERLWFYRWMGSVHAIIHGVTQSSSHERDAGLEQLPIRLDTPKTHVSS